MKGQFLIITFFFLIFSLSTASCQNNKIVSNVEIKKLLPEGKFQFEILDSMEITTRQTELTYKFQEAYQENMDSFNAYFEKIRNNQKAKYPENELLSEKEFFEYFDYVNNVKLIPSRTDTIEVVYSDDNRISFKTTGKLEEILNQITYYGETNTFDLGNRYILKFIDSVNVETNTNAFQEAWKGYNWEFTKTKNIDIEAGELPDKDNIHEISIEQYKITLGRLISGKTFMIIKLKDFREGNWVVNVEVPIRMK